MNKLKQIDRKTWKNLMSQKSLFHGDMYKECFEESFPYARFIYFNYNDTHALRLLEINGRYTSTPFLEGGDIVATRETKLNRADFNRCVTKELTSVSYKINTRLSPVKEVGSDTNLIEFVVSFDEKEAMLERFRNTLRHTLTSGEDKKLVIEVGTTKEKKEKAYELYLRSIRHFANLALAQQTFFALCEEGDLWIAYHGDVAVSMAVFLPVEGSMVMYALSASTSEGRSLDSSTHVLWYAMQYYKERGNKQMSLGSTREDSSLLVFKRGWRGDEYPVIESSEGSGGRVTPLRKCARFLPLSLYPWASKMGGKFLF